MDFISVRTVQTYINMRFEFQLQSNAPRGEGLLCFCLGGSDVYSKASRRYSYLLLLLSACFSSQGRHHRTTAFELKRQIVCSFAESVLPRVSIILRVGLFRGVCLRPAIQYP